TRRVRAVDACRSALVAQPRWPPVGCSLRGALRHSPRCARGHEMCRRILEFVPDASIFGGKTPGSDPVRYRARGKIDIGCLATQTVGPPRAIPRAITHHSRKVRVERHTVDAAALTHGG